MANGYHMYSEASSKQILLHQRLQAHILLRVCHGTLLFHKKTEAFRVVFNFTFIWNATARWQWEKQKETPVQTKDPSTKYRIIFRARGSLEVI